MGLQQLAGPCVFIATTQNASLVETSSMLIFILIDLFSVIPQRHVPYRLPCYLMTKNLNVAAIDSAQFGTWLIREIDMSSVRNALCHPALVSWETLLRFDKAFATSLSLSFSLSRPLLKHCKLSHAVSSIVIPLSVLAL